jgi:ribosomal-protein-alanine N-acetyltransferase
MREPQATTVAAQAPRAGRLSFRPFAPEDVEPIHDLFVNAQVRRHLLDDEIVSADWVRLEIRKSQEMFERARYGLWSLSLHGSTDIIGFCGFRFFHHPPELQLLYALHPSVWRRGLATEAAEAALRYAFEVLGLSEVVASADAPNLASIRVMERIGMEFQRREVKGRLDTVYYRITNPVRSAVEPA